MKRTWLKTEDKILRSVYQDTKGVIGWQRQAMRAMQALGCEEVTLDQLTYRAEILGRGRKPRRSSDKDFHRGDIEVNEFLRRPWR